MLRFSFSTSIFLNAHTNGKSRDSPWYGVYSIIHTVGMNASGKQGHAHPRVHSEALRFLLLVCIKTKVLTYHLLHRLHVQHIHDFDLLLYGTVETTAEYELY